VSLSTVTTKGQETIPKDIRESMAIDAGDKIEFIINAQNDVVIKPITKKAIDVFGQLSQYNKDKPLSIEEMNEAITTQCKKEFS
jgi:AbrB family looped-hinge helix DNA binding protein